MWPGQQTPGGERDPHEQGPHEQRPHEQGSHAQDPHEQGTQAPGPHGRGPYAQGPYAQGPYAQEPREEFPNPYRQPPPPPGMPPAHAAPEPVTTPIAPYPVGGPYGMPPGQQPPPPAKRGRTTVLVAVVAAAAVVVAAAAVGGVLLLGNDDRTADRADADPSSSASAPASPSGSASGSASASPSTTVPPTIPGWKTVVNPQHGTAFDVPPEWEVAAPSVFSGYEDDTDHEKILIGHTAPAFYKSQWCSLDSDGDGRIDHFRLATTGTKGADGAKDTRDVAEKEAPTWVFAAYTQPDKSLVKWDKPVDYTTASGVKGTYVTAHSEGAKKPNKCTGDGRSVVFGFKNGKGDFVAWDFYGRTGVPGAVGDELIMRIMSTVRLTEIAPAD
ncbi:hypothetical protein ABZY31_09910 [Streptomyces sp. NPDC006529]|uniref:hypothetical protein n=1 Tax=Streptomyces sp. NPDC006529 TaxID=3157177 RepID=UPI0033AD9043